MTDDRKKYNYMDAKLNEINKKISLSDEEVKRNDEILQSILSKITEKMREKDYLFNLMYRKIFYGGSYYDNLKVDKPDEYDLYLVLDLPAYTNPTLTISNIPAFVFFQLKKPTVVLRPNQSLDEYQKILKLADGNYYLDTQKVKSWIEGLMQRTLNDLNCTINTGNGIAQVGVSKHGPAFNMHIKFNGHNQREITNMDIDLVPCFQLNENKWPPSPFRRNPISHKNNFYLIPKLPKNENATTRYWRLCFQEQERELIKGKETLKPTIRLLKKLRNELGHDKIVSYYIKTVVLWINDEEPREFWNNSQSYVFITILQKLQKYIEDKKLPYYWNKRNNLLDKIHSDTLANISNRLLRILSEINRNPGDPTIIEKYLIGRGQQDNANKTCVLL